MSFSRTPKRIAGPGFHVNVRYDDESVSLMRSSTTSHPSVGRVPNDEVYDVKEMELLVIKDDSAHYYDGYAHCFSSVNGYPGTAGLTKSEIRDKILSEVQFAGVAVTEYQPSKAYAEQGFVSQVGGVVTLINEGAGNIEPGQKVQLGLNLAEQRRLITRDKGIPREKVRFCIEKADDETVMIAKALKTMSQTTNANAAEGTCITGGIKTALETLLKKTPKSRTKTEFDALDAAIKADKNELKNLPDFLRAYRQENKRVIGKALGSARPGDRVEILLQPRHAY